MAFTKQSSTFYDVAVYGTLLDRVRDNTLRMFARRGYDVSVLVCEKSDYSDAKLGISMRIRDTSASGSLHAIFVQNAKVNIEMVNRVIMARRTFNHLFIVYDTAVTPDAARAISEQSVPEFTIESFTFQYMLLDPIGIVPHHSRLPAAERPHQWTKLPKIRESDAIARYYGFRKNDIVRIDDGDEIAYRVCV